MLNKIEYLVKPDQLDRMELFDNRKNHWTMEQVQEHLGCDVVFPGPYFDSHTFQPVVYCKIGGEYLCNPRYNNFGMIIAEGKPQFGKIPQETSKNYVTNDVLVINSVKRAREIMTIHPDGYQRRGRAVLMQLQDNSLLFRATRDGGREADTVLGEQEHAVQVNAKWAINYDGGRSANIITPEGSILVNDYGQDHTRIMPVYIIAYLEKENKPKPKEGEITMVQTYSLKKDGDKKLSPNFRVREFACHDGSDMVLVDTELVKVLQKIRDAFGRAVHINSAYRTKSWNRKNGGATHSQHLLGKAADIHLNGVRVEDVAGYAEYLHVGGLGMYNSFTHVDVRSGHARWRGDGKPYTIPKTSSTESKPWYADAQERLTKLGVTDGSNPNKSLTRAQAWVMLDRLMAHLGD